MTTPTAPAGPGAPPPVVVDLFATLKALEGRKDDWPGSEVVPILEAWFAGQGIDTAAGDDDTHACPVCPVRAPSATELAEHLTTAHPAGAGPTAAATTTADTDTDTAIAALGDALAGSGEVAERFTCTEADIIAYALCTLGRRADATTFLHHHAYCSDDRRDDYPHAHLLTVDPGTNLCRMDQHAMTAYLDALVSEPATPATTATHPPLHPTPVHDADEAGGKTGATPH